MSKSVAKKSGKSVAKPPVEEVDSDVEVSEPVVAPKKAAKKPSKPKAESDSEDEKPTPPPAKKSKSWSAQMDEDEKAEKKKEDVLFAQMDDALVKRIVRVLPKVSADVRAQRELEFKNRNVARETNFRNACNELFNAVVVGATERKIDFYGKRLAPLDALSAIKLNKVEFDLLSTDTFGVSEKNPKGFAATSLLFGFRDRETGKSDFSTTLDKYKIPHPWDELQKYFDEAGYYINYISAKNRRNVKPKATEGGEYVRLPARFVIGIKKENLPAREERKEKVVEEVDEE